MMIDGRETIRLLKQIRLLCGIVAMASGLWVALTFGPGLIRLLVRVDAWLLFVVPAVVVLTVPLILTFGDGRSPRSPFQESSRGNAES